MRIQYLGTAASEGWPALFCRCRACMEAKERGGKNIRTRAQALINGDLLLDFGPDTYHHMLTYDVPLRDIKNVLITHSHSDHFYPYDIYTRRPPFAFGEEEFLLHMYGNDRVQEELYKCLGSDERKDLDRYLIYHELDFYRIYEIGGYKVIPLPALHNRKERCMVYSIEKDGKRLLYAHDTGYFKDEVWEHIRGLRFDAVSLDCTTITHFDGNNHMGIENDRVMKELLIQNGCADENTVFILNHFSHGGGLLYEELKEATAADGFLISYDGRIVEF